MEDRVAHGTVQQFLDHAANPQGKILNALDFPGWDVATPITSFASDLTAWHYTRGAFGHTSKQEYPRGDMNWYLAGAQNALTYLHIDSDGLNTHNFVFDSSKDGRGEGQEGQAQETTNSGEGEEGGMKVWMMAEPLPGRTFAAIDLFLDKNFSLEEATENFVMEAIVLSPGTRMYV